MKFKFKKGKVILASRSAALFANKLFRAHYRMKKIGRRVSFAHCGTAFTVEPTTSQRRRAAVQRQVRRTAKKKK